MMKNTSAYRAIADVYEELMDVDYDAWAAYVLSIINEYSPGKKCADLGCGSGAFTRRFKRAGLDVIGVDVSEEMLTKAAELTRREGLSITYLRQDVRSFKAPSRLDCITAVTDCFNYLPGGDLVRTFKRLSSSLVKGGLLFFDVSTEYKLYNVIGDNLFGEDGEDFSYLWFNRRIEGGVEMDISTFTRQADGTFIKREEQHVQYAHTKEQLISALEESGFEVVRVEGHLGEALTDESQRLNVIAVRK